jgi:hypothetical protein
MGISTILAVLVFGASAAALRADLPPREKDFDQIVYQAPIEAPTDAEVWRALPKAAVRDNVVITTELLAAMDGPVRFYPGVGNAALDQSHFKCTVFSSAGVEVVYIDRSRLRPAP